jgi:hypothetical protein
LNKCIAIISLLLLLSCRQGSHFFIGDMSKCNLLDTISFANRLKNDWPSRKPSSVADAVNLLDSMADENFKCMILRQSDDFFYFNLGLKVRNDWVRHGTGKLKDQLFNNCKLSSIDYSSGFIIEIYREVLRNRKVDLVAYFSNNKNNKHWPQLKTELVRIQNELLN